jgi:hypothetical protein
MRKVLIKTSAQLGANAVMPTQDVSFIALIIVFLLVMGLSAIGRVRTRVSFQRLLLIGICCCSLLIVVSAAIGMTVPGRSIYHYTLRIPGIVCISLIVAWVVTVILRAPTSDKSSHTATREHT